MVAQLSVLVGRVLAQQYKDLGDAAAGRDHEGLAGEFRLVCPSLL
jgi:hypothetical protein